MSTVPLAPERAPRASAPSPTDSEIQAGQIFGHYRIVRLLGRGGMGAVYEAEDLENSRRVALKILSHKLDSPESRQRFFREGRLAASINHPNSVYIFGTEEVGGTPAISMELLSGGTLHARVLQRGPMPVSEAVDAILQILDGLEAAQSAGILHRDVKPSNCFVDVDGTVKVGDFGLSISTAVRTEPALTADGSFLGTPAFCPPEQIRGEELNSQSDIYSVGATLFYLITGKTPFEAHNVVALIATVLEKPSPSPRELRRDTPEGLAKIVQRCMHKVREERYKSYLELRRALEPYSSTAPVPAPLGTRFLAGLADFFILNVFIQAAALITFGGFARLLDAMSNPGPRTIIFVLTSMLAGITYYGILEGTFGAAAGKALCKLRVVGLNKAPPGLWRSFLRAAIYTLLPILPFWIICIALFPGGLGELIRNPRSAVIWVVERPWFNLVSIGTYVVMALLFVTARRRNGYSALHDLLTHTHVILRTTNPARTPMLAPKQTAPPATISSAAVGPYRVIETIAEAPGSQWLLCYDTRLLRKVWVHQQTPGAEPFPLHLRNVGRPGRLRWLTARRSETEAWDAFEAPGGQSFNATINSPQPWEQVRLWLHELATEIAAAKRDHTEPAILSLDRLWITEQGSPKILDFPAPGNMAANEPPYVKPEEFLAAFARIAVSGGLHGLRDIKRPLPLHARRFISQLPSLLDAGAVLLGLVPLMRLPASVSRYRRAAIILGCIAFPLFAAIMTQVGHLFLSEFERLHPDLLQTQQLLSIRESAKWGPMARKVSDEDFAVVIATRYRGLITNKAEWNSPLAAILIKGESRRFAEKSILDYRNPTPEQIKHAAKVPTPTSLGSIMDRFGKGGLFILTFCSSMLIYICIPAVLCALAFKTGLVQLLVRVAYVRTDGAPASRLRILWRSIVTWAPIAALAVGGISGAVMRQPSLVFGSGLMLIALTAISLSLRERSLQDRLAGTWPVIR